LSNEGNVPEAIAKGDNHCFFHTGHFSSSALLGSLFFFDAEAEFKYPDWLTMGKVKRKNY